MFQERRWGRDSLAAPCLLVGNLQILGTAGGGSLNIRLSALVEKLTRNFDSLRMKACIQRKRCLSVTSQRCLLQSRKLSGEYVHRGETLDDQVNETAHAE